MLALIVVAGAFAAPPVANPTAYIPPQCYAQTVERGRTHNGCFACHQTPRAPNFTDDAAVQTTLSFARAATENRWANALKPVPPAAISDAALLAWVRRSNYLDDGGAPRAIGAVAGFTPDCRFRFDARGFDRAPDGALTGWRAYRSTPFPGMFWPTNGSAGDVMIRLPAAFRTDESGRATEIVYSTNLAILEAMLRRADVALDQPVDERALGVDLEGDGQLAMARWVSFAWPARTLPWVGAARSERPPVAGLFPLGTEFLHSLRYFDVVDGKVRMAARMKELRYLRKVRYSTYAELEAAAEAEAREKQKRPDATRKLLGDASRGLATGNGWVIGGFIEDATGALRPQTVEETAYCVGCHGGVGATADATFSFARKLGGVDGWRTRRSGGSRASPSRGAPTERASTRTGWRRWAAATTIVSIKKSSGASSVAMAPCAPRCGGRWRATSRRW